MEAYNEKKALKRQGESDSLDRVRDTGIPAGSDGAKQSRCETPPAASCHHSLELGHLPLTPCHTLDHPVTQAPPPEQEEILVLTQTPLLTCPHAALWCMMKGMVYRV